MKKLQTNFKNAAASKKLEAGPARKESHKSEVLIDTSRPAYSALFESPMNSVEPLSQCQSKCTLKPPFKSQHATKRHSRGHTPAAPALSASFQLQAKKLQLQSF
jgi:hypothetical protein